MAGIRKLPASIAPTVISPAIKRRIDPTQKREEARITGLERKSRLGLIRNRSLFSTVRGCTAIPSNI
jgi:hypothetical protein